MPGGEGAAATDPSATPGLAIASVPATHKNGNTMVNFPGRNDRRRRVLKEEVLSTSTARGTVRAVSDDTASGSSQRYSDAAGVENHPQITDFVPRRYRTIVLLVFLGSTTVALQAALNYFAAPIAAVAGIHSTSHFELAASGNLASWTAAVVLLVASAGCLLTYSIRRHRIDDYRGRYRIWLAAAAACLVMSANSVVGFHHVVADMLGHFTGWSALRDGAVWSLMLAGVPMAWILFRALLDMRESRFGAAMLILATLCYATSVAGFLGFIPTAEPRLAAVVVGAPILFGHWLVLAAIVAYARFVVLDAQGLITVRPRRTSKKAPSVASTKQATIAREQSGPATATTATTLAAFRRTVPQPPKAAAEPSRWIDGSRPERENYDDEADDDEDSDDRKLSKSERKRLRKLKAQQRAA
jgi:hypothetical protein